MEKTATAPRLGPGKPKPAKPMTLPSVNDHTVRALAPISTKIAHLDKEAGYFAQAGKATARTLGKVKDKVIGLIPRKAPPPPQLSGVTSGMAGAGAGALIGGAAGALTANEGDRVDSFARKAVLGAGLGAGAGLIAKGPANEYLAQRHKLQLLAAKAAKKTKTAMPHKEFEERFMKGMDPKKKAEFRKKYLTKKSGVGNENSSGSVDDGGYA